MRKHYLHVRAYRCNKCEGPVISGSTGVRENEISNETGIRDVGAICLSCGHRPDPGVTHSDVHDFPPVLWDTPKTARVDHMVSAYFETVNREELY